MILFLPPFYNYLEYTLTRLYNQLLYQAVHRIILHILYHILQSLKMFILYARGTSKKEARFFQKLAFYCDEFTRSAYQYISKYYIETDLPIDFNNLKSQSIAF